MDINHYFDDIVFTSLRKDLSVSTWKTLRKDCIAGLTVALLTIPQTMAYALVAGLPMSCGIFSAIFAAMVASLCGSSRHLIVGPTSAIAILIQAGTAQILYTHYRDLDEYQLEFMAVNILMQLSLMVGIFQLLAATLKIGRLTQFVSHPVIIGYLVGVASAVGITQLYTFLGIPRLEGTHSTYENMLYLLQHLNETHAPTVLIGALSLCIFWGLRKLNPRIPAGVIGLFIVSLVVGMETNLIEGGFFGGGNVIEVEEAYHVSLVGDTGLLHGLVPTVGIPYFNWKLINSMIPFAFAVSLLGVLEAVSVGKSIAATSGQRLSVNQEILGLGLGNIVASVLGAMPLSGSPSRSMLNYQTGAKTRFSAIFSAGFVALFLFLFEPVISQIPLAALAALLLMTVGKMVNRRQLALCMNATGSDAFVLWTTVLSCLFFSLDTAFYIGVSLSITLYLRKAAAPQLIECAVDAEGSVCPMKRSYSSKDIRFIKVEGELFFGAADIFHATLKSLAVRDKSSKVIIIQVKNARDMDATACLALQQLHYYLSHSGRHLVICGVTPSVERVLHDSRLDSVIGKENLFFDDETNPTLTESKALERARQLIRQSDDIAQILAPTELQPKVIALDSASGH